MTGNVTRTGRSLARAIARVSTALMLAIAGQGWWSTAAQATEKVEVRHNGGSYYISARCYDDRRKGVGRWHTNIPVKRGFTCKTNSAQRNVQYVRVNFKTLLFKNKRPTQRPKVPRRCQGTQYACVEVVGRSIDTARIETRCGKC